MDTNLDRVRAFHTAFGRHVHPEPWMPPLGDQDRRAIRKYAAQLAGMAHLIKMVAASVNEQGRLYAGLILVRLQLHVEETAELAQAWVDDDLAGVLDALCDISYVTDGTTLMHGLQGVKEAADQEVHRANMSKLGEDGQPILHASGRVVKGPNYRPPELKGLLP